MEHRLAEIINSETPVETTSGVLAPAPAVPVEESKWFIWRSNGTALIRYLLDSEVHTFAFSAAANAILSFIPFVVLLYKLAHFSYRSQGHVIDEVIAAMVGYFFPSNQSFVAESLRSIASQHSVTIVSVIMILIACTGIFLPLEVALNQAWGVKKSRNYLFNQAVAFGLALLMVALGMGCVFINVLARNTLSFMFFGHTDNFFFNSICFLLLAATTGVASILFFFSIYWLLPNRKVPWRPVFRTALVAGVIWLASKYLFIALLPHLDLRGLYGPFYVSVGLLFWAYTSGLIMFAGAQFSVTHLNDQKELGKSTGA
jgi:YihY family inner membrane protein